MQSDRRHSQWALALSVVLHALLIALALWLAPTKRVAPREKPLIVDFIRVSTPQAVVEKVQPPPIKVAQKAVEKASGAKQPTVAAVSPAEVTRLAENTPASGSAAGGVPDGAASAASRGDLPKNVNLFPSVTGMLGGTFGGAGSEATPGQTLQNGPGEVVDAQLVAEVRAEKAQRQLNGVISGMVADAARGAQLIDPWFVKALNSMRDEAARAPVPESVQKKAPGVVGGYLETLGNYGATGNPFGDAPEATAGGQRQALSMAERANIADPGARGDMNGAAQMMAAPQAVMQQMRKPRLETLIELEQMPNGAVANASIIKTSGVPDFDELALHRARKTFVKLDEAPDAGFGLDPRGFRTVWRFRYTPPSIQVDLVRVEKGHARYPFERAPQ